MEARSCLFLFFVISAQAVSLQLRGINQAGAEFGSNVPGVRGQDYQFPEERSIKFFVDAGHNVVRIPILWERIQTQLNGPLDVTYAAAVDSTVNYVTNTLGVYAIVDVHNYLRYKISGQDKTIGESGSGVTISNFANLWTALAQRYKSNSRVIFGLMNEPHDTTTENVFACVQAALSAIRNTGASQMVMVDGNGYTGAHSWSVGAWYGTSNAQVMQQLNDPLNNVVFDMHQYFDSDYSGRVAPCKTNVDISAVIGPATTWLRTNNRKGFIGETGIGANSDCYKVATDFFNYLAANNDVWLGYSIWAAGPMWGDNVIAIDPTWNGNTGTGKPQWTNAYAQFASGPAFQASTSNTPTSAQANPAPTRTSSANPPAAPTRTSSTPVVLPCALLLFLSLFI